MTKRIVRISGESFRVPNMIATALARTAGSHIFPPTADAAAVALDFLALLTIRQRRSFKNGAYQFRGRNQIVLSDDKPRELLAPLAEILDIRLGKNKFGSAREKLLERLRAAPQVLIRRDGDIYDPGAALWQSVAVERGLARISIDEPRSRLFWSNDWGAVVMPVSAVAAMKGMSPVGIALTMEIYRTHGREVRLQEMMTRARRATLGGEKKPLSEMARIVKMWQDAAKRRGLVKAWGQFNKRQCIRWIKPYGLMDLTREEPSGMLDFPPTA